MRSYGDRLNLQLSTTVSVSGGVSTTVGVPGGVSITVSVPGVVSMIST